MDIRTGTTTGESVLPASDAEVTGDDRRGRGAVVIALVLIVLFVVAANAFVLPYYAISPGSALDTAPLVSVPDDSHYFRAEGKVLLTTVSLGKVTLLEALQGWLDPVIDVVPERVIAGPDVDEEELRTQNLQAMDESKKKAIGVAFEALGIDAINGDGVEIVAVSKGAPADGLVEVGETIVEVDGVTTKVDIDAVRALAGHRPGDTTRLKVVPVSGGAARDVETVLVENPERPGHGFFGVGLSTKNLSFDFPFQVDVASEQIGGPSAGLAFTLAVIDALTEGELTGGHSVAATGTIELDGTVGEVGGVAQKTIAVKNAGAELFMVPSGEFAAAKRFAGDDLRIEIADTLEDALRILATLGGNGLALPKIATANAA